MDSGNNSVAKIRRVFFIKNLITYFVLLLVPVIIFCLVAIAVVERDVINLIETNTNTVFNMSGASIEDMLFSSSRIGIYVNTHADMLIALLSVFQNGYSAENNPAFVAYNNFLDDFIASAPYIHSVCLYKEDSDYIVIGGSVRRTDGFGNEQFMDSLAGSSGSVLQKNNVMLNAFEGRGTDVITFITALKYGMVLAININEAYVCDMLDMATQYPSEKLFLADSNGEVITGNHVFKTQDPLVSQESYLRQSHDLLEGNYRLVSYIPDSVVHDASHSIFLILNLVMGTAFIASAIISLVLTRNSYKKINEMLKLFEKNGGLDDIVIDPVAHFDMYHYVVESIARSYIRETRLKEKVVQGELDLTRTQLSALQYQINPHFIFNTLQMIDIAVNDDELRSEASHMIGLFSSILRYSIQNPSQLVSLEEEISITRMYIRLQDLRMRGRAIVLWDYEEEEIEGLNFIRMFFQPVLENIFQHGIRPDGQVTTARIRLKRFDDFLFIAISDNGPGMSNENLLSIRKSLRQDTPPSHHIGLYNVNRRLELIFGPEARLRMLNIEGGGLHVTTKIPLQKIRNDTF